MIPWGHLGAADTHQMDTRGLLHVLVKSEASYMTSFLISLNIQTYQWKGKLKEAVHTTPFCMRVSLSQHQKPSGYCFEIDGLWIKLSKGISVIRKTVILSRSNGQVLTTNRHYSNHVCFYLPPPPIIFSFCNCMPRKRLF